MSLFPSVGSFRRTVDLERCVKLTCDPAAVQLPRSGKARALVLSRGLLLYRWLDLQNVPRGKRVAVASAQLLAWSPFDSSSFRVVWFEASAALFAWDQQRLSDRLAALGGVDAATVEVIPEPWLVPAPVLDGPGVRLVQGFDGYEGQVWQQHSLRASRFWAELPEEPDWLNFLRGASVPPEQVVGRDAARIGRPQWQAQGWGRLLTPKDMQDSGTRWERRVWWWGSLALVAATAAVGKEAWVQRKAIADAEQRLSDLQATTAPVVKTREAALDAAGQAQAILALFNQPDPLALLDHLTQRLASQPGLLIREFEMNGPALRLVLSVPANAQRSSLVQTLESGGWLVDVSEAPGAGTDLVLTMRVNGPKPPMPKPNEPSPSAVVR